MPSIQAIQDATTAVTVEWGAEKINLQCLLSRASRKDKKYIGLIERAGELSAQLDETRAAMVEARANVLGIKFPSHKEILALRVLCEQSLRAASDQLRLYAIAQSEQAEGREPEMQVTMDDVSREFEDAWTALNEFDADRIPTERTLKERGKKADAAVKELEAKEEKLDAEHTRVLAERLAYLVAEWDLTDGGAMWPITAANIATLRPDFITHMLNKVEERVLGFFTITNPATTD